MASHSASQQQGSASWNASLAWRENLRRLAKSGTAAVRQAIERLSDEEAEEALYDYELWARPNQLLPPAFADGTKSIWLALAGRGWGKTWVGACWIDSITYARKAWRIALIGEDAADARDVIVEGESGILAVAPPWNRPHYEPSKRRLTWPSGAVASLFSDADPEQLRGPQHDHGWIDELAKYKHAKDTWSNFRFGFRLGANPQAIITTTPKPVPIIRDLVNNPIVVVTRGSSYENRANLAPAFYAEIVREYEGTTLGRQELDGELIDPEEAGIIKRSWFGLFPADAKLPPLEYVVISYDTAFTEKTTADFTACQVWAVIQWKGKVRALLLDAWAEQISYPVLRERAIADYRDSVYGPEQRERKADVVLIEAKGSGISLQQDLERIKVPTHAYNPGRADKTLRLHSVSHLVKHGLALVPESSVRKGEPRDWTLPVLEQVCSYAGKDTIEHDDHGDAFSQCMIYLRDKGLLRIKLKGEDSERKETEEQAELKRKERKQRGNPYAR